MSQLKHVTQLILLTLLFSLFSCSETDIGSGKSEETTFSYNLASVFDQSLYKDGQRGAENFVAKMIIHSHSDNRDSIIDWYVTLNEAAKTVESNMTLVLAPDVYDFTLEITDVNRKYVASKKNVSTISTPEDIVELILTPLIGDVTLNFDVTELPQLKFSYPPEELAEISVPKIGYVIDGAAEVLVELDKTTGENSLYLNLPEGEHTVSLRLYDDVMQIGNSRTEHDTFTLTKGVDVKKDIIPLFSTLKYLTAVHGGAASFNLSIPADIIDEVGSLSNLQAVFRLNGARNTSFADTLTITPDGVHYSGTVSLSSFFHDIVSVDIEFSDLAKNEIVAHAVLSDITVNTNDMSVNIPIQLYRRAIVGGNLLAVIGVNVFDQNNNPAPGATVRINGELVGITGSGTFGTAGFLSFFAKSGNYALSAEKNGKAGADDITVSPLGVDNYVVVLDSFSSTVEGVTSRGNHTLFLKNDNSLWGTGKNEDGQLGIETVENKSLPVWIADDVKATSAGSSHSLFLKNDNTLWAMGKNDCGQLGDGTVESRVTPVMIMSDVKGMCTGFRHSLILKNDNTLWVCGSDSSGELGNGVGSDNVLTPQQIMTDVKAVSSGSYHSMILKNDNTLWIAGSNKYGQVGDSTTVNKDVAVMVMSDVKAIAAGRDHSLLIKTDNSLWATGYNRYGQLGDGTENDQSVFVKIMDGVAAVQAKYYHSLILKGDNTLWGTGHNGFGQLGDGTVVHKSSPILMASDVASMTLGFFHSIYMKSDNSVWATGYNRYGQLGNGTVENVLTAVEITF